MLHQITSAALNSTTDAQLRVPCGENGGMGVASTCEAGVSCENRLETGERGGMTSRENVDVGASRYIGEELRRH